MKRQKFIQQCCFWGLIVDCNLKYNIHINNICKKISKSIGILYKIRDLVPKSCLLTIYYSFIYPYFLYCIPIWGSTYKTHLNPLIVLQKRAVRLINNSTFLEHTNALFRSSKLLKLEYIYTFTIALYMYKNIQFFDFNRLHFHNTRNRNEWFLVFEY